MGNDLLLVVWPEYPPGIGGMQIHGVEFTKFLHQNDHPALVVTRAPDSSEEVLECRRFDNELGFSPLRIMQTKDLWETLAMLRELARALRPACVYSSQVAYAPAFATVPRVVCRSAGNDILRPWIGPYNINFKRLGALSVEEQRSRVDKNREWVRQAAADCDAILCNSQWTADQLARLNFENLSVVRGGVDTSVFKPSDKAEARAFVGWDQNARIALIAARHVLKKGIDTAIEATARLGPDFRLVVAGTGPETPNLISMSYELGVSDRVGFIGPVPHAQLPRYINAADVVLAPSRSVYDPHRFAIDHETMCRSLCEAAACGTPAVASRSGGIPDVVRDEVTGLLVRPNDPEELAGALLRLAAEPGLASRLGEQARRWANQELSFERVNRITMGWIEGAAHE